ncbi:MAG: anaerobic ribonucleoside-triphosphate reductase activating protein [Rhodocyclaceae bacterium]
MSVCSLPNPLRVEATAALRIGGFVPCSTQDWPDQLAAVVFIAGCPWRCGYCHNPHLQTGRGDEALHWADLLPQLVARKTLLDGVVFSGGEPTLDRYLPEALHDLRAAGMANGLHTAGCYPHRLARVLPLLDWVGLDIKALPGGYDAITGVPDSGHRAWTSLGLVQSAGIDYEVRVTAHPDWLSEATLDQLLEQLAAASVPHIALQAARLAGPAGDPVGDRARYPLSALSRWARDIPGLVLRGF